MEQIAHCEIQVIVVAYVRIEKPTDVDTTKQNRLCEKQKPEGMDSWNQKPQVGLFPCKELGTKSRIVHFQASVKRQNHAGIRLSGPKSFNIIVKKRPNCV